MEEQVEWVKRKKVEGHNPQPAPGNTQVEAGSDAHPTSPFPVLSALHHDTQHASGATQEVWLPFVPPRHPAASPPSPSSPIPFQELPIEEVAAEPGSDNLSKKDQAQIEAENALQQAREEADRIRRQAWHQGYRDGWQAGKGAAEAEQLTRLESISQKLRGEVETFLQNLTQQVEEYLARLEPDLLTLTLEVARKVVKEEIHQDPQVVLRIIKDALRRVGPGMNLRIRVNPLDLGIARENKGSFLNLVEGLRQIEIIEDRRVEQGGCLIETGQGIIDAQPTTQFQEIGLALWETCTTHHATQDGSKT